MARRKTNFNGAVLHRAISISLENGLTVERTIIGPDGGITLIHVSEPPKSMSLSADQAFADWQEARRGQS